MREKRELTIIEECANLLNTGKTAPWKVEEEITAVHGVSLPENCRLAALSRQKHIEDVTGEKFRFISVSNKPYKVRYLCEKDDLILEIDARDEDLTCSLCGEELKSLDEYAPLVASYVGGCEDYYSYAGRVNVKGGMERKFTNLLVYGTGLGPIGITRGSFLVNRAGGAEVKVSDSQRAARCLGLIFKTEALRREAMEHIERMLPGLKAEMNDKMSEFGGKVSAVELERVEAGSSYFLYVDFSADFSDFRGHGDISRAVGLVKKKIEAALKQQRVEYEQSVIAQGYDGDLKPSPRNKRGRYASARLRVPRKDFEALFKVDPDRFLSFVEIDRIGAQKLACAFYSGMGGEIIPAVYKATKVNPRSSIVSSFQNIFAGTDKGDVIYGVEIPNVESGVISCREGLIPPSGREALRIMGIRTAREFAVSLAAQVLAGEFNLALEISREKLYS